MNEVKLIGNVGSVQYDNQKNGKEGCLVISLATNKKWLDKAGNECSKSEWHKVVIFGQQVEWIRPKILQGVKLFVNGELVYREYEDSQKIKKISAEVIANIILVNHK